jgi:uncharacterized protein HemY
MDKSFKSLNNQVDLDQLVKLLIRCNKMYEAKQSVMRLLKMTIDKDRIVTDLKQNKFDYSESQQKDMMS